MHCIYLLKWKLSIFLSTYSFIVQCKECSFVQNVIVPCMNHNKYDRYFVLLKKNYHKSCIFCVCNIIKLNSVNIIFVIVPCMNHNKYDKYFVLLKKNYHKSCIYCLCNIIKLNSVNIIFVIDLPNEKRSLIEQNKRWIPSRSHGNIILYVHIE